MRDTPQSQQQIVYEFTRATTLEGWWVWAALAGSIAVLLFVSLRYYRRDTRELSQPVRITLMMLRFATIASLIFFFFDLNRRTEQRITRPSEVAILVDTSQSMSLPSTTDLTSPSRAVRVAALLGKSDLLESLSEKHRVSVYTLGDTAEPRLIKSIGGFDSELPLNAASRQSAGTSGLAVFALFILALGLILGLASVGIGAAGWGKEGGWGSPGWWIFATAICLILGITTLGSVACMRTEQTVTEILGLASPAPLLNADASANADATADSSQQTAKVIPKEDWQQLIAPSAAESRIGDALRGVLADHDPATLAGIVLISDGQSNGGSDAVGAVTAASRSEVAIYPVGLGSSDAPVNVRVVDLDAPRRVYPGDKFTVTGVLQASGPQPISVEVQLIDGLDSKRSDDRNGESLIADGKVVDSQRVTVNNDGTLSGIRFEMEPESVGRRRLSIRVIAPPEDRNRRDDHRSTRYEVVSRKLRVLTIAGGPTREYRFVRNLLFRDQSIELDAWLQTGQPGMSQDVDRLITSFPATAEALFEYDAIIFFDPDWTAITAEQLELLDRWVSRQAGGMILVAGPVYHPRWLRRRTDPRVARIAGFFPVNLSTGSQLLSRGRQGGKNAWPLDLTHEARRAEFLWIDETPESSFQVWQDFGGVCDFIDVKSAKAGAKVYAYYSDPTTEINGTQPVYLASQFYGAGRVYFQASGEMWRLRGESDTSFNSYYTKLVRWISEGRLLRDSNRGLLLLDASRAMVGDTLTIRAVLTDEQFEPLDLPSVPVKLLAPGGRIDDLTLMPLEGEPRPGTYGGRFVVREAGNYEVRLTLGDVLEEEVLRQNVQVRLPTIELERPRRHDDELQEYAKITGGQYLPVNVGVSDQEVATTLIDVLKPQPQTTILPGTPDIDFTRRRNALLMCLIAAMLSMEWVTRRLHRLA